MKTIKGSLILMLLILNACGEPQVIKSIQWNDHKVTWEVLDAGATTSYRWIINVDNKKIFESYSTPYINNIQASNNDLLIYYAIGRNDSAAITINYADLNDYQRNPVVYERDILKSTNDSYIEPHYIRLERERFTK